MRDLTIRALAPGLLDDYLGFFDREAFSDNREWAGCYCYFYLYPGAWDKSWEARSGAENRAAVSELIRSGRMHGQLAYQDGQVVGWCHAAPRPVIPNLDRLAPAPPDPSATGAIACFVIRPANRRQGIARRLLAAACTDFHRQGLAFVEAYPAKGAASAAQHYHGPLELYLSAGFTVVGETERSFIVRKPLRR